jgi:Rho GDP-dissociation inhibitor
MASSPTLCIKSSSLVSRGRPDVTVDGDKCAGAHFTIKEGVEYSFKLDFTTSGGDIRELRYLQKLLLAGLTIDKREEKLGDFAPNDTENPLHSRDVVREEAPSGLRGRNRYQVTTTLRDADTTYAEFDWGYNVARDWA